MGISKHCARCERTTNHTLSIRERDDTPAIYECPCGKYRTDDETDNGWLQLLEHKRDVGIATGKEVALDELGYTTSDSEWWEIAEGLDPDEAELEAAKKRAVEGMP